jgi:hypothetical protein
VAGEYEEGTVEQYDNDGDCYILAGSMQRFAVQFHQFTVEEEERSLVLKVVKCTRVPLPSGYDPDIQQEEQSYFVDDGHAESRRLSAEDSNQTGVN